MSRLLVLVSLCAGLSLASACALAQGEEPLSPLPQNLKFDAGKVALGERLFEAPLAKDHSLSCASCHNLAKAGVDARPDSRMFSTATGGMKNPLNTPTVFNSGFNFRQQWSGGGESLEDQVDKVVTGRFDFDSSWPQLLDKLSHDAGLAAQFKQVYPGRGVTKETVQDALAVFLRSLITPSRFDRYLRGDASAISGDERRGYERFKAYGCVGCHQGVNVGGNMLQRFGAMNDYFADRAKAGVPITEADRGRFNVTKKPEDMYVFKVPSLRNVALTAPYFHNGSAATLEEAVDVMFRYQLGRAAPAEDKTLIVKFLKSLNGERFKE